VRSESWREDQSCKGTRGGKTLERSGVQLASWVQIFHFIYKTRLQSADFDLGSQVQPRQIFAVGKPKAGALPTIIHGVHGVLRNFAVL
jgi:hypothetical protein